MAQHASWIESPASRIRESIERAYTRAFFAYNPLDRPVTRSCPHCGQEMVWSKDNNTLICPQQASGDSPVPSSAE